MALSSVAIVAGVATLAASLFKNTELRVIDIVELSKLSVNDIENNPQLKIVKNDINEHITGIKDPAFHEVLIEIMASIINLLVTSKKLMVGCSMTIPIIFQLIRWAGGNTLKS
ncbi:hypothetical protein QP204_18005 [Escherichia coli]|nr:hypothetical protein [Escherichia coli]